jgi:hypothetical protein
MKRNFYLVLSAVRELRDLNAYSVIETIFPDSDMRDHLQDKLSACYSYGGDMLYQILSFYEKLDHHHQRTIDEWVNSRMDDLEKRTTPYPNEVRLLEMLKDFKSQPMQIVPAQTELKELRMVNGFDLSQDEITKLMNSAGCDVRFEEDGKLLVISSPVVTNFFLLGQIMQPHYKIKKD